MRAYYNSRDEYYKKPFGAVNVGEKISYRIKVYEPIKSLKVHLCMWKDAEKIPEIEMDKKVYDDHVEFFTSYRMPSEPSLIWYHFRLSNIDENYYYSNNDRQSGGEGKLVDHSPISYQQTVYEDDRVPTYVNGAIVYQIFPDRFSRGSDYEMRKNETIKRIEGKDHGKFFVDDWNKTPRYNRNDDMSIKEYDFYGGTLKGIEEKLSYLKSLGVSLIYLNPIFEARSNHRYDTGDYMKVDSLLGDENSLKSLIKKAEKLGIRIVLDGVFSHQGADSKYFDKYGNYGNTGAYKDKKSKYYEWYNFAKYPDEYESWWGVGDLPNTKEMTESYLNYICKDRDSVVKHYMKLGIAGFRLDVADELPDAFIKEVRNAMNKVNKDNILVGEVWEDATNKVSYEKKRKYFVNGSLNSVTNYPFMESAIAFMKGKIDAYDLFEFFYRQLENYPKEYLNTNFNLIDSHDRVRIITELSDSKNSSELSDDEKYNHIISRDKYLLAISRLKVLSLLQYTIPGMPVLYYGDEVGVYGYEDPYNRKTYPWGMEDMDLYSHYIALGKLRNEENAIKNGDFVPVICTKHTFGFKRTYKNETIYVIINRGIFEGESDKIELDENGIKYVCDINPLGYKVLKFKEKKWESIM